MNMKDPVGGTSAAAPSRARALRPSRTKGRSVGRVGLASAIQYKSVKIIDSSAHTSHGHISQRQTESHQLHSARLPTTHGPDGHTRPPATDTPGADSAAHRLTLRLNRMSASPSLLSLSCPSPLPSSVERPCRVRASPHSSPLSARKRRVTNREARASTARRIDGRDPEHARRIEIKRHEHLRHSSDRWRDAA